MAIAIAVDSSHDGPGGVDGAGNAGGDLERLSRARRAARRAQRGIRWPGEGGEVAMPRGLIGLTITLGLKDEQRTPWDGEVTVSEGRVLSPRRHPRPPNASSEGSKFKVATKKAAAKKAAAKEEEKGSAKKAVARDHPGRDLCQPRCPGDRDGHRPIGVRGRSRSSRRT